MLVSYSGGAVHHQYPCYYQSSQCHSHCRCLRRRSPSSAFGRSHLLSRRTSSAGRSAGTTSWPRQRACKCFTASLLRRAVLVPCCAAVYACASLPQCASATESDCERFKNERNYRIPVKSDPSIVIKHIKESHLILKQNLGELGALSIGGAQCGSTRRCGGARASTEPFFWIWGRQGRPAAVHMSCRNVRRAADQRRR